MESSPPKIDKQRDGACQKSVRPSHKIQKKNCNFLVLINSNSKWNGLCF